MSACSKAGCHAVLAPLSGCYPPLEGRSPTCYSPVRHSTQGRSPFRVRLACVRHAASVDSEPGSNSHVKACFDYPKAIKQTINASSLLIIGSALLLLLSEYPRAPESKPPAPCWLILDGLSASAPCGASARLCLHVLFSFQRTDPAQRASAIPDAHSPRLAGPDQPRNGRIQGNLLRLLQPLSTVNPHPPPARTAARKAKAAATAAWVEPSVLLSDLGARKPGSLGTTNAEGETRYYAPRKGLSTPVPARITYARTASHTAGQPSRESERG